MAITDSIQANTGLCLVSAMKILFQLTSVYLLCHQHELWDYFLGLMPGQQYFNISWNCTSQVPCFIAFLTMAITIAMGINPGAPGWNILEWIQNNIRSVEVVCSITVIKQTFLWNSSRKVLDACSRKVL